MDQNTSPVLYTCAVSGETSPGKHYVLNTTEGQELVCAESLFHNGADRRLATVLVELQMRVAELENRLGLAEGDKPEAEGDNADQAAEEPAKPAKKTAAKKTAAAAKKAGD